ncbi:hypothetical protein [Streptomyces sp. NPDC058579]|uniref:hypothetical protein n=1 Tax=Streptomyces sp. NPDC058579 TaxID=3346548 RepID=UPI00365BEA5A
MRSLRALLLLPATGLLAGCGIGPAGPDRIEGTAPAVTVAPSVYWVTPDGKLRGVAPQGKQPATPLITESLVKQLLRGPSEVLTLENLASKLPAIPEDKDFAVTVTTPAPGTVTVALPHDVSRLGRTAVGQIVCTVWSAEAARRGRLDQVEVILTGSSRRSGPYRCADFPAVAGPSA